jgi:hypothetical protein
MLHELVPVVKDFGLLLNPTNRNANSQLTRRLISLAVTARRRDCGVAARGARARGSGSEISVSEGPKFVFQLRSADGDAARLPKLANDLVSAVSHKREVSSRMAPIYETYTGAAPLSYTRSYRVRSRLTCPLNLPTRFELVNMKTAKALGIDVP